MRSLELRIGAIRSNLGAIGSQGPAAFPAFMTNLRILLQLAALGGAAAVCALAGETNVWPFWVGDTPDETPPLTQGGNGAAGNASSWTAIGPFFYSQPAPEGERVGGFRPFYIKRTLPSGGVDEVTALYPIFYYRSYGTTYSWSIFKLINRTGSKDGSLPTAKTDDQTLDIWPFYFSRNTGEAATSYHAVMPIEGTVLDRFGYDKLSWTAFPLYFRTEKHGAVKTSFPWPFLSVTEGTEHGMAVWPIFGRTDGPDDLHREFFLWPLGWNNSLAPGFNAPEGAKPTREVGFLPFYTAEHGTGFDSENFAWPFFGYSSRTIPYKYEEDRYFWPFLVQGRGDDHYVDRWGPFYTHSEIMGMDKTWVMWPLWRQARWTDDAVLQTKTQFFYFLYWSLKQQSPNNPAVAPAEKVHVWPLYGSWDNGRGHRQVQVLDPLEVFFPNNDEVRQAWTPLFAVYRYDEQDPETFHGSLLWNGITWGKDAARGSSEFHLGPLLSVERRPDGRRISLGSGLVGLKRPAEGSGWRLFWFEFSKNHSMVKTP